MGSNSFGNLFRITTWGESHGKAIGVVIDGCPAGLELDVKEIQSALDLRKPGNRPHTSPRNESDEAEILSGIFEGKTTGAPISIQIANCDSDPSKYEPIKDHLRPGHANFTYLEKYGIFDYRGGGRSSGRETACRVAAGAVAKKMLAKHGIECIAFIKEIGGIGLQDFEIIDIKKLQSNLASSLLFCPDPEVEQRMIARIEEVRIEGDSLGGIVECVLFFLPVGLGDPVYEKLEANLACAMLSIPATKGVEFGAGFQAAKMKGSEHNDLFTTDSQGNVITKTNHAGGLLGGISNGMPLSLRVAFKPTSSILKPQDTLDRNKIKKEFKLPEGSRHDPCIAIRAVPVVEAMAALVVADAILTNKTSRIDSI